jgi:hypothetical protein
MAWGRAVWCLFLTRKWCSGVRGLRSPGFAGPSQQPLQQNERKIAPFGARPSNEKHSQRRNLSEGRLLERNSELSPSFYVHFFMPLFLVRHTRHTKACHCKLRHEDEYSWFNVSTLFQMSCKTHAASLIITQTRPLLWAESLPSNTPAEIYLLSAAWTSNASPFSLAFYIT